MDLQIFIYSYFLLIIIFINNTFTHDTYSHIDKNYVKGIPVGESTCKEIEKVHLQYFKTDKKKYDSVCALSAAKKIALCDLIYKIRYYQHIEININKIAFYEAKLQCEMKELSFSYINDFKSENKVQFMYPCHGRRKIIHTSFIEDEFYDKFYISSGSLENSVAVYVHISVGSKHAYHLYDYIYNVNLLKLQDIDINKKEIVQELKLNKELSSTGPVNVENIYKIEQFLKKSFNDPICDLIYEKKITLCNMIIDKYEKENRFPMKLNKAASYMYDMSCLTKPIYEDENKTTMLQRKQKIFPCFSRPLIKSDVADVDNLHNVHLQIFHLSSGSRRNSVFVYILLESAPLTNETFIIYDLIGNINLKNLKPTIISTSDLIVESLFTYEIVQNMINDIEQQHRTKLLSIITSNQPAIQEIELIIQSERKSKSQQFKYSLESFSEDENSSVENFDVNDSLESASSIKIVFGTKDKIRKSETSTQRISEAEYDNKKKKKRNENKIEDSFPQIGPQVYMRLLEKVKKELTETETSSLKERYRKKLMKRKLQKNEKDSKNLKLSEEALKLIKKMEIIVTIKKIRPEYSIIEKQ